jgi:two-component system chemotaxis response regulator CheY
MMAENLAMAASDSETLKARIMIVDDETFIRKLIARMLTELGFRNIIMARDGVEAVSLIVSADPPVDLAIVDLQMPQVDGFQFIDYVRNTKGIPNPEVPLIILSGHSERNRVLEAAKLGINGYLVKPVSKNSMLTMIKRALAGYKVEVAPAKTMIPPQP